MINKFMFLVTYGLKKKLKSKAFIISNIVLFVLLIAVTNIDTIINFFGGDFNDNFTIYVLDNVNGFDIFKENFEIINGDVDEEERIKIVNATQGRKELEEQIEDTTDVIVELLPSLEYYLDASIITDSYMETVTYQSIVQSINNTKYSIALSNSNIDEEELIRIESPVNIERVIMDEDKNKEEENMNMIMSVVFPTLILPFFMLIILLVQMIGSEINEEKSTRSMEVIISNVSAKTHFFSKLLANNLFIIFQGLLLLLYGGLGLFIRNLVPGSTSLTESLGSILAIANMPSLIDKLFYMIPITLILMILSFIAYSLIAGILASMTVNAEDFQQIQTPIMIILLIGYYLSVMSGMFNGSLLIKILSYVPLISCLLAPALLFVGQIGFIDVLISIAVLIIFILILTKYGLRIYKIGILNYSTDKLWTRIFKAVRKN